MWCCGVDLKLFQTIPCAIHFFGCIVTSFLFFLIGRLVLLLNQNAIYPEFHLPSCEQRNAMCLLTALLVVIYPWSIEFEWLRLCVDKNTDRTVKGDGLLHLARVPFANVHVEVKFCTRCCVFKMAESLLKNVQTWWSLEIFNLITDSRNEKL